FVLNDYYSSDLSTFQRGSVRFPFDELSAGNHSVELTVWDVHNNSSKSTIEFIVAESEELAIERVLNYPNPFTTRTEFYFEHNQNCEFLNVLVEVFTVSGKLVKTINTVSNTAGFRNEPIPWNGRDDFGDRLATGTYVYKVSVKNPTGETDMKFEKLVILN
ncbi:MAG TPA: FlgD immunoglobulin-like domain containing protein, partial [Cryomorphaceae bacterium]|nr:FlgD immunoglobulin-like domain containing protein [Cryomorphaceae bacterium]